MHLYLRLCLFILKLMSWNFVDRIVTAGVAFRDFSAIFTCPIHCGQSSFFPFLSGLSVGLLLGLLGTLVLGFYLFKPSFTAPSSPADPGSHRSVHPRLRAYRE